MLLTILKVDVHIRFVARIVMDVKWRGVLINEFREHKIKKKKMLKFW